MTATAGPAAPAGRTESTPRPPLVELERVSRRYERTDGAVAALEDVTLRVDRGELVSLTGPSGAGKSTLLHVIGLLDTATAGRYRLAGADVGGLSDAERTALRNRRIGFVFQSFHLIPHLTVAENVELPLVYRRERVPERRERAREALRRVGLERRLGHRPDELSGGEQQRTAIARALVAEPALLLADEPTGNLDDRSAEAVLELVAAIHAAGTTVVLVTHDERVARRAERRIEIVDGRIAPARPEGGS